MKKQQRSCTFRLPFTFKYAAMHHLSKYTYQGNHLVWYCNFDQSHLLTRNFDWRCHFLECVASMISKVKKKLKPSWHLLAQKQPRKHQKNMWTTLTSFRFLNLNRFHILLCCFRCWLSTSKLAWEVTVSAHPEL